MFISKYRNFLFSSCIMLFFHSASFASGACECRIARINNNWGEAEMLYVPNSHQRFQYYHQVFTPNVTGGQMIQVCRISNQHLVEAGVCSGVSEKTCHGGLGNCG
mgnify:CR=1 FL=1